LVAEEVVRRVAAVARPVLISPRLDAHRLPGTLDPRTLLVRLAAPGGLAGPADGTRVAGGLPTAVPVPVHDGPPAAYGALAHASAERLEGHAARLEACAGHSGWDKDEAGERFRTVLLNHAERCARAAADVRGAAGWLADDGRGTA
ncbi:hypothetical protein GPJ59_13425, partial [Streptomyces bambusae]|nr:hypothetical protein [Streptomyces bambusae]